MFFCDFRSIVLTQYVKMKKKLYSHTWGCGENNDTKQGKYVNSF